MDEHYWDDIYAAADGDREQGGGYVEGSGLSCESVAWMIGLTVVFTLLFFVLDACVCH